MFTDLEPIYLQPAQAKDRFHHDYAFENVDNFYQLPPSYIGRQHCQPIQLAHPVNHPSQDRFVQHHELISNANANQQQQSDSLNYMYRFSGESSPTLSWCQTPQTSYQPHTPISIPERSPGHSNQAIYQDSTQQSHIMPLTPGTGQSSPLLPVFIPPMQQHKLTTSLWEDEGTVCYQMEARGICIARRQDNDMVNGTKLLNVTGMSRGKRDGILKNEQGRIVVKIGAMHLKGVWIPLSRAKVLADQYNITQELYPLFVDNPGAYFYASPPLMSQIANYYLPTESRSAYISPAPLHETSSQSDSPYSHSNYSYSQHSSPNTIPMVELPCAPSVPSMMPMQSDSHLYGYNQHSKFTKSSYCRDQIYNEKMMVQQQDSHLYGTPVAYEGSSMSNIHQHSMHYNTLF